jgi:hypothetical protein
LCHRLLRDARLPAALAKIDADLAAQVRAAGCPRCGARLHSARFPRKPRGEPRDSSHCEVRLSFCCATCRRRATPASVRFLGRRVYVGCVVVLVSAMLHGVTPSRAARLKEFLGISRQTLGRWRAWWRDAFPRTALWRGARALFVPALDEGALPSSLLTAFLGTEEERLFGAIRFLSPLSASAALVS